MLICHIDKLYHVYNVLLPLLVYLHLSNHVFLSCDLHKSDRHSLELWVLLTWILSLSVYHYLCQYSLQPLLIMSFWRFLITDKSLSYSIKCNDYDLTVLWQLHKGILSIFHNLLTQDDKTKQDFGVMYSCIYFVHLAFQLYTFETFWPIGTGTKSIIKYTIQVLWKVNADTDI